MPKIAMLNQEGAKVGEIELSEAIFASEINESVLHLVVRASWPPSARAPSPPRPAARFAEAAVRSTVRRAPATLATMATARRSSPTAASYLRRSRATMS